MSCSAILAKSSKEIILSSSNALKEGPRLKIVELKVTLEGFLFVKPSLLDHLVKLLNIRHTIFLGQKE